MTNKKTVKKSKKSKKIDGFDYQCQQKNSSDYYEKLRKLPPECRTPQARLNKSQYPLLAEIQEPDARLGHYRTISQMKIASSFNDLAYRWLSLEDLQRDHVRLLLTLFRNPGNDIATAIASWQELAKKYG